MTEQRHACRGRLAECKQRYKGQDCSSHRQSTVRKAVKQFRRSPAGVRSSAAPRIWHPSGSIVQSLAGSTATNQAGIFTSGLFNSINGPLIFASYSHESWTVFRRQGTGRVGFALERLAGQTVVLSFAEPFLGRPLIMRPLLCRTPWLFGE
jgi:hypothetical protein